MFISGVKDREKEERTVNRDRRSSGKSHLFSNSKFPPSSNVIFTCLCFGNYFEIFFFFFPLPPADFSSRRVWNNYRLNLGNFRNIKCTTPRGIEFFNLIFNGFLQHWWKFFFKAKTFLFIAREENFSHNLHPDPIYDFSPSFHFQRALLEVSCSIQKSFFFRLFHRRCFILYPPATGVGALLMEVPIKLSNLHMMSSL